MASKAPKKSAQVVKKAPAKAPARAPKKAAGSKMPAHYAVPKSEGDAAVQAWIDLLPDWQSERARRIDAVVTRQMPHVHKAVKWHGVWYGVPGKGWFLAFNSFKAHLKLVFFDGTSLVPVPPGPLATQPQRALDVREADPLDEARLAGWVKQAHALPGWGKA